jgi:hypothetical protein
VELKDGKNDTEELTKHSVVGRYCLPLKALHIGVVRLLDVVKELQLIASADRPGRYCQSSNISLKFEHIQSSGRINKLSALNNCIPVPPHLYASSPPHLSLYYNYKHLFWTCRFQHR